MGPMRGMMIGGVAFGAVLLSAGVFLFLIGQNIIAIELNLTSICAIGLVFIGIVVLGGTLYGARMARGGWRRWMDDSEREF